MRKKAAAKKKLTLTPWDPIEHLTSEEAIAAYLEAAMEEGGDDPAYIAVVLGDIAKARGILSLSQATGMTRAGLYRSLSKGGNPSFATIVKVASALGYRLTLTPQKVA